MNPRALLVRIRQFSPLVILSGAILLAVAGYLQALHYPFVNDDTIYVVENTKLAGLQLAELWRLIA